MLLYSVVLFHLAVVLRDARVFRCHSPLRRGRSRRPLLRGGPPSFLWTPDVLWDIPKHVLGRDRKSGLGLLLVRERGDDHLLLLLFFLLLLLLILVLHTLRFLRSLLLLLQLLLLLLQLLLLLLLQLLRLIHLLPLLLDLLLLDLLLLLQDLLLLVSPLLKVNGDLYGNS